MSSWVVSVLLAIGLVLGHATSGYGESPPIAIGALLSLICSFSLAK